jgi:hypothetical protein
VTVLPAHTVRLLALAVTDGRAFTEIVCTGLLVLVQPAVLVPANV